MNIDIPLQAKVSDILNTVQTAEEGSHIYCSSDRHFSLLKICLIKLQKTDLNIYQLDQHGFTLKQVSARRKDAQEVTASAIADSSALIDSVAPTSVVATSEPLTDTESEPLETRVQSSEAESLPPVPVSVPREEGLTNKQVSAVRDLEQALRRCKELELLVVGFSDGLVAVPETLGYGTDAISSAEALEVESFDVYRGYEPDEY